MKKLIILFTALFATLLINAQSVAINTDGSTAAASSILDVKSTNKGMLTPRMTSVQRTTIASPANGLLVYDTDTKSFWYYNGASWINMAAGGAGGFTLPFSQTVNTAISAFQLANQSTGAAIEGSSSAQFGTGMTAKSTGEAAWSLYAFSSGAGSQSIRSYADNGTAFHGENNNATNTNTLLNLLNKGAGKTGSFQLANNSSTSPNVQVAGNHLGHQLKIYQTNASNTQAAVSIENSGTGAGLYSDANTGIGLLGESNTNYGVKGVVNNSTMGTMAGVYGANNGTAGVGVFGVANFSNGAGVYGSSANGTGVGGFSDTHRAVQGLSNSGTALYGSSSTSYALETNGKVKIAGGNTNPGNGKVLTSDASGNATWQSPTVTPKIAFMASGIAEPLTTNLIPSSPDIYIYRQKVEFKSLGYDMGNVYSLYSGTVTNGSSCFTVPVNGLYHFDAALKYLFATTFDYRAIEISLMLRRNGTVSELRTIGHYVNDVDNTMVQLNTDYTLLAGDQIFISTRQYNLIGLPSPMIDSYTQCFFSGHLVFTL